MIILSISQLSSCRYRPHKYRITNQTKQLKQMSLLSFHGISLQKAPEGSDKDEIDDPVFGASYRTVPGGPKPLHN
ncbi:hypothetical protein NC652_004812 [Populus alba x Populus x berolinensis]|nr:hypothetical protein NC652_004812 [Populus alba x Populus x berolinensis]